MPKTLRSFIGQFIFAAEHIAHGQRTQWDFRLARRKILNTISILLTASRDTFFMKSAAHPRPISSANKPADSSCVHWALHYGWQTYLSSLAEFLTAHDSGPRFVVESRPSGIWPGVCVNGAAAHRRRRNLWWRHLWNCSFFNTVHTIVASTCFGNNGVAEIKTLLVYLSTPYKLD